MKKLLWGALAVAGAVAVGYVGWRLWVDYQEKKEKEESEEEGAGSRIKASRALAFCPVEAFFARVRSEHAKKRFPFG